MSNLFIYDAITGKETSRELTEEELKQIKAMETEQKAIDKLAKNKADARLSALAKLAALGLTEAEIASL